MERGPTIFIIVLVLGIVGFITFDMIQARKESALQRQPSTSQPGDPASPQADLEARVPRMDEGVSPEDVMAPIALATSPVRRDLEAATWQGIYLPEGGWVGGVDDVVRKPEGYTFRMYYASARVPGGGFWIDGTMPDNAMGVGKNDTIAFDGRVAQVSVQAGAAGGQPTYRIGLEDFRILRVVR